MATGTHFLKSARTFRAQKRLEHAPFFLHTKRLGFRVWSEDDLPLAHGLSADPEVKPGAQVEQLLADEIATQREHGVQYWPLFLLATGEHFGCCGLHPYDPANSIYAIWCHLQESFRGRGLAEEAAAAVIDYAFATLGASALFAEHPPHNLAARHLLRKLGFQYTHTRHDAPTGLDHLCYIRTRSAAPLRFGY